MNIITDLAILFLPFPILTKLRLPKKQKIILVVTFSFGAFVAVVDVIRIAYLQSAALDRLKGKGQSNGSIKIVEQQDFPWNASLSFMWSAVEVNLGIVCACVPSLKPLFLKFLPSFIKDKGDPDTKNARFDRDVHSANVQDSQRHVNGKSNDMLTNPAAFKRPTPTESTGYGGEKGYDKEADDMGFLDFLAGPEDQIPVSRTTTRVTRQTTKPTTSNFTFYDMNRPKNMLTLSNKESIMPVAIVTILFFLWGFAYGLLNVRHNLFLAAYEHSDASTTGLKLTISDCRQNDSG